MVYGKDYLYYFISIDNLRSWELVKARHLCTRREKLLCLLCRRWREYRSAVGYSYRCCAVVFLDHRSAEVWCSGFGF